MRYSFRKKPYKHQVKALRKLLDNKFGGALLMEPRTGKTKVVVDYASILWRAGKIRHVLVVCPIAALTVWRREIRESCADPLAVVQIWDRDVRASVPDPPDDPEHLVFVLINDDAFSVTDKRSKGAGRLELRNIFRRWGTDLCVVDESHRMKTPSAKRSRVLHMLGEFSTYRVIMTGTPVTKRKRVSDIYSQWKFLNPARFAKIGITTHADFKDHFQVWTTRPGYPLWLRNKNTKQLRKLIHKDAYEIALADCRDMPKRLPDQIISVSLADSRQPYDDMVRDMIAELESGDRTVADISLVQIMRLAQITSGFAKTDRGEIVRIGDEKLRVLRSLLEDWFEAGEKIIVAARFREDIRAIAEVGAALRVPVSVYQGGMSIDEKDAAIEQFQKAQGAALFVGQPKAMSLSIDLSVSHTMVWYSLTNSYVDWDQACKRIALSPLPQSYVYLRAEDTIDEELYLSLKQDKDVVDMIRRSPERLLKTSYAPR